jgi:diphthine-ammonia ligase
MKVGVLFSGGKDSTLALAKASEEHQISCIISLDSKNKESYMFHTHNIHLTKLQARAMQTPLILEKTAGEKEEELKDMKRAIKKAIDLYEIEGLVSGAINSVYQATRIQKICNELKIFSFNPLWLKSPEILLKEILEKRIKAILVGVHAFPLDASFLGKKIDENFIRKIMELNKNFGIHPCGEGGEYESLVIDAPFFKSELKIKEYKISGKQNSWRMDIEKAILKRK